MFELDVLDPPTTSADGLVAAKLPIDFYAMPYPNDLRLDADGTPSLARFPRPDSLPASYTDIIDQYGDHFGATQAVYFRFEEALDEASLPMPADTTKAGASIFLVDVTVGSAHLGEQIPVEFKTQAGGLQYIGPNWLAVHPVPGYAPREGETYAAIVTDAITANGKHVKAPAALGRVLDGKSTTQHEADAVKVYAPLVTWLATQGDLKKHVAAASVYTTQKGSSIMDALRTAVLAQPAPVLASVAHDTTQSTSAFDLYTGLYNAPNFQEGDPPYLMTGGMLHKDASGAYAPVRTEMIRVAFTIPKGTMPANGWPTILVAHGTGGDYETFVQDGTAGRFSIVTDKSGAELARFAVISIDQVLHGTRAPAGTDVDLAFFNFQNILAARDNPKQGGLDDFQLMRLVQSMSAVTLPDATTPVTFDKSKLYFFGHSQGSLTGALYVGSEPDLKAAIFSGAGAGLVAALLYKTQPVNIVALVSSLFFDPVDRFHPFLNVLQSFFDESDPANYTRRYITDVPAGQSPKNVYVSLGLDDSYAPDPCIEPFALGVGVTPVNPQLLAVDNLDLSGKTWTDAPIVGNAAGGVTGVLCEYDPKDSSYPNDDGHFVVFDVPAAEAQSTRFFGTHAQTGTARLDPP